MVPFSQLTSQANQKLIFCCYATECWKCPTLCNNKQIVVLRRLKQHITLKNRQNILKWPRPWHDVFGTFNDAVIFDSNLEIFILVVMMPSDNTRGVRLMCPRGAWKQSPLGVPWVSGLVGHFVQTWSDSECSHTVQFLDCIDLN